MADTQDVTPMSGKHASATSNLDSKLVTPQGKTSSERSSSSTGKKSSGKKGSKFLHTSGSGQKNGKTKDKKWDADKEKSREKLRRFTNVTPTASGGMVSKAGDPNYRVNKVLDEAKNLQKEKQNEAKGEKVKEEHAEKVRKCLSNLVQERQNITQNHREKLLEIHTQIVQLKKTDSVSASEAKQLNKGAKAQSERLPEATDGEGNREVYLEVGIGKRACHYPIIITVSFPHIHITPLHQSFAPPCQVTEKRSSL